MNDCRYLELSIWTLEILEGSPLSDVFRPCFTPGSTAAQARWSRCLLQRLFLKAMVSRAHACLWDVANLKEWARVFGFSHTCPAGHACVCSVVFSIDNLFEQVVILFWSLVSYLHYYFVSRKPHDVALAIRDSRRFIGKRKKTLILVVPFVVNVLPIFFRSNHISGFWLENKIWLWLDFNGGRTTDFVMLQFCRVSRFAWSEFR